MCHTVADGRVGERASEQINFNFCVIIHCVRQKESSVNGTMIETFKTNLNYLQSAVTESRVQSERKRKKSTCDKIFYTADGEQCLPIWYNVVSCNKRNSNIQ